jgi:hypothetical protein
MAFHAVQRQSSPTIILVTRFGMHSFDEAKMLVLMARGTSLLQQSAGDHTDMGFGVVQIRMVAAVAVRAPNPFLPVDVVLKAIQRD